MPPTSASPPSRGDSPETNVSSKPISDRKRRREEGNDGNAGAERAELKIDAFLRGRCQTSQDDAEDLNPRSENNPETESVSTNDGDDIIAEPILGLGVAAKAASASASTGASPSLDDDLLPEYGTGIKKKNGKTPYGRIKTCMCPNPIVCRQILYRWARIKEGKYVSFHCLPHRGRRSLEHVDAYRLGVLRSLGYVVESGKVTRTCHQGSQESTIDNKIFSGYIAMVHFPPEVWDYVSRTNDRTNERKDKSDRWRIPLALGEKLGLKDIDKCPASDSNGEQSFFALPNYSMEEATRDVERAEAQYKQQALAFHHQNDTLLKDMATDPSKVATKIHAQEQEIASLAKTVKELKERLKGTLAEKNKLERNGERLERGLEKLARRMDKWESTQNIGDSSNQYAKDIYKAATGKDLSEDGHYCATSGKKKGAGWADPRMDRATQAKWDDPSLSLEEALRMGGFEFPPLGEKGVGDKKVMDSENVSVHDRKKHLYRRLMNKRRRLEEEAANDPDAAKEYKKRYPPVEEVEGVYGGFDLRAIPDQPLVRSSASSTGFRGVQKTPAGRYQVYIGCGSNGKKKNLGTFDSLEEAAEIYARARFYMRGKKRNEPAGADSGTGMDSDYDSAEQI